MRLWDLFDVDFVSGDVYEFKVKDKVGIWLEVGTDLSAVAFAVWDDKCYGVADMHV